MFAFGYCIAALDFVSTEVFGESVLSLMIVFQLKRELDVFQRGESLIFENILREVQYAKIRKDKDIEICAFNCSWI